MSSEKIDTGKHYRYSYMGIKMDPYRIFQIFNVTDAKAQHAIKKLLRFEGKGHTQREVWMEIRDIVDIELFNSKLALSTNPESKS